MARSRSPHSGARFSPHTNMRAGWLMTSTALSSRGVRATAMISSAALGLACLPHAVSAQTQTPAEPTAVSEVIVTGSLLPTTPDAIAVLVQTVTSDVIAKGGVGTNALDILRKEVPAFEGRTNFGSSTAI